MQAYSPRIIAIAAALVIASGLVWGAFALTGPGSFFGVKRATAESTEELLRAYAAKDTDSDGLPDWQESLYGTDPRNPDTDGDGVLDGVAVAEGLVQPKFVSAASAEADAEAGTVPGVAAAADTLTDRFARTFFDQYLSQREGIAPSEEEVAQFVADAVADLAASASQDVRYTSGDARIVAAGGQALTTYAVQAEAALNQNDPGYTKGEVDYLHDVFLKGDAAAIRAVRELSQAYASAGVSLIAVPVPASLAGAHVQLANALAERSAALADIAAVSEDPLRGMVGLGRYRNAAEAYLLALADMAPVLTAQSVSPTAPAPGSEFVEAAVRAAELIP